MKKILILAVLIVFSFSNVNAQDGVDKVVNQAKNGGFYAGANLGLAVSSASKDFGSFNFGFDLAYLFEVMENLEVGLLVGYTQFVADGGYSYEVYEGKGDTTTVRFDYKDASFIPISSSARYYFNDRRFFGGLDLGYAVIVNGDADSGFYVRPKFGFNLGVITLIASYQSISGGIDYYEGPGSSNNLTLSGFNSFNAGAEFSF